MKSNELHSFLHTLLPRDFHMELESFVEVCHAFGDPQRTFRSVHIAGTNGKGSTIAFLSSLLQESGYRVGLATSPHLEDFTERIQVDGHVISISQAAKLATLIRERLGGDGGLSFFEFLILMSFLHFQEEKVALALIETGLGGRLDATNVLSPTVSILTPISFDHERYLGENLTDIAREKCGIIKRGVPTVTAIQEPSVMEVIQRTCDDVGSPLFVASPQNVTTPLGLAGEHQRQNAACALEAATLLTDVGFTIKNVEKALLKTRWPGRLETILDRPRVLLDGAHNPQGAQSLARYLEATFPRQQSVLLVGALADKDIGGILRPLLPCVREVVCVRAPSPRSASPKDLAAIARSYGAHVTMAETTEEGLKQLLPKLSQDDALIVAGSLTVVGAAKTYFAKRKKE